MRGFCCCDSFTTAFLVGWFGLIYSIGEYFTIGNSNPSFEYFIDILKNAGIDYDDLERIRFSKYIEIPSRNVFYSLLNLLSLFAVFYLYSEPNAHTGRVITSLLISLFLVVGAAKVRIIG